MHSQGWRAFCSLFVPDFVPKTQNPSIHDPRFTEFTIPSLDDCMDGDRVELLLCPIEISGSTCRVQSNAVLRYLLFSATKRRKQVS